MGNKQSGPTLHIDRPTNRQGPRIYPQTLACSRLKTRMSLRDLDNHPQKKNDFLKAWKLIKALPPSNPNSFWSIASYHGMPFKDRRVEPLKPATDKWWDGYCQHSNVLFPPWHRFYCLRLEQALQTVLPDGDVALHYWDETSEDSLRNGVPTIVLVEYVEIDGETVPNPLRNFTIPVDIDDGNINNATDSQYYVKPAGYTTIRYPFSGIVNPPKAAENSRKHNEKVKDMKHTTPDQLLNENVSHWLNKGEYPPPAGGSGNSIFNQFEACLEVPNYNVFSNVASATFSSDAYTALEQPHNDIHLAIGGFTNPKTNPDGSVKVDKDGKVKYYRFIEGANGDMGENETASFDPIFFLHHCNIDRMFWVWQKKWNFTKKLTIDPEPAGKGTSPTGQGPTPDQAPDAVLNMKTILYPFQNELGVPQTPTDCINVEDLGYTYTIGSLDRDNWPPPPFQKEHKVAHKVDCWQDIENILTEAVKKKSAQIPISAFFDVTHVPVEGPRFPNFPIFVSGPGGEIVCAEKKWKIRNHLKVKNLDKDAIQGSFVLQVFHKKDGKLFFVGQRAILDRWNRGNCTNCRQYREAAAVIHIDNVVASPSDIKDFCVLLVSKDPATGKQQTIDLLDSSAAAPYQHRRGEGHVSFIKRFDEDISQQ